MKILQINVVYNTGSTGKITYDMHKALTENGFESAVCYGRGELVKEANVYKTCPEWYSKLNNALSRVTGIMYGGCFFSTNKLISVIKKERPDVVHLQCINGYFVNIYRLVTWLKKNKIKTILTLHAEFMYTANCGHALECDRWKAGCGRCPRRKMETKSIFLDRTAKSWQLMKKAFDGFDKDLLVVSVSPWLMERAKQSPILQEKKHSVVFNGLDKDIFHHYETSDLRKQYNCENKKIVFHATPTFSNDPNHIKGGYYILELAKKMPEVQFIIAGDCDETIHPSENVVLLGKITDQTLLARYYSMADVTVIASKRETFSMIVAESLCCGTPVVGFKAGGPEKIALTEHSVFVAYGDLTSMRAALMSIFNNQTREDFCEEAAEIYSVQSMFKKYTLLYKEIMGVNI